MTLARLGLKVKVGPKTKNLGQWSTHATVVTLKRDRDKRSDGQTDGRTLPNALSLGRVKN